MLCDEKKVVTACPEIMVHERGSSGKEELLLLACDGVWDVFDDQDAGEFLVSALDVPLGEVGQVIFLTIFVGVPGVGAGCAARRGGSGHLFYNLVVDFYACITSSMYSMCFFTGSAPSERWVRSSFTIFVDFYACIESSSSMFKRNLRMCFAEFTLGHIFCNLRRCMRASNNSSKYV